MGYDLDKTEEQLYDRMQDAGTESMSQSVEQAGHMPRRIQDGYRTAKDVSQQFNKIKSLESGTQRVSQAGSLGKTTTTGVSSSFGKSAAKTGVGHTTSTAGQTVRHGAHASKTMVEGAKVVGRGASKAVRVLVKVGKQFLQAAGKVVGKAIQAIGSFIMSYGGIAVVIIIAVAVFLVLIFSIFVFLKNKSEQGATQSYIDSNNVLTDDAGSRLDETNSRQDYVERLSPSNAACKNFYELMSQKSVWQLQPDGTLINATDEDALEDYFDRDEKLQLSGDFLYCLNDAIFGDSFVYPEAFIKPVSYNTEDMTLVIPVDESGNVCVSSVERNQYGEETSNEMVNVSEYGLGSVVTFTKAHVTEVFSGAYIAEDIWNEDLQCVEKQTYAEPVPFSFTINDEEVDVLDKMVCMAGSVDFEYDMETIMSKTVSPGSSSAIETDVVSRVLMSTKVGVVYTGYKDITYKDYSVLGTGQYVLVTKRYTRTASQAWLEAHGYSIVNNTRHEETYELYRYRSSDSSVTVTRPVPNDASTFREDHSMDYYHAYLSHFCTYAPTGASRTYGAFERMTSASSNISAYGGSGNSVGSVSASQQEFIDQIAPLATADMEESGILASVTMAQCIIESGWGKSSLSYEYHNYFGIKAGSAWEGDVVNLPTREETPDGGEYWVDADFCAFDSIEDCFREHSKFLWNTAGGPSGYRYRDVAGVTDYREAITIIKEGGYATDNEYVETICKVIETYNLTQYDTAVWSGNPPEYAFTDMNPGGGSGGETVKYTRGLSETDRAIFEEFYHQFDDLPDGKTTWSLVGRTLTQTERQNVLIYTNNFMYGTYYEEEDIDEINLMSDGFIELFAQDRGTMISGGLLGEIYPTIDGFVTPFAETPVITSHWGDVRSLDVDASGSAHKGVDLAGLPEGTPMYAIHDGEVIVSKYSNSAGYYIVVQMEDGNYYEMMHMYDMPLVSVGDTVVAGQQVGGIGTTGNSTGVHLHLQMDTTFSGYGDGLINAEDVVVRAYQERGILLE